MGKSEETYWWSKVKLSMPENDKITMKLFNPDYFDESNSTEYKEDIIEQYKLYVEMADRISSRRLTASSFFLSVNTAIVALAGFITRNNGLCQYRELFCLIAIAGIILSYMWYRLIRSYRDLNTAKFKVIHLIESKLPLRPYDAEWEAVGRGKKSKLYLPFTHIEVGIPWTFFLIHLFMLVRAVRWVKLFQIIFGN